ncbi:E3 ubiquitin-protein ligase TRIM63-like [Engraulis encrasicolus]|uniref:E3 ubiquitin-protein ligase TRIM63-like n=1 Tax=Engraulis encrasicolus TaxID=184585 RepID=UPI002FD321EB
MSVSVQQRSSRKPSDTAMDDLEKQLICPICLEIFSKPVVILPCQHNLCRKCANDIFQASNPYLSTRSSAVGSGGRFRCPSCRHEVVLDRHGVYGLQRNLLVENIIDMFKQQEQVNSSPPEPEVVQKEGPMCEVHEDERINIYCVTCATPTCSMCKVFGAHKDCQVAPLNNVYDTQKAKLTDCISMLVGNNDRIQGVIGQLEESCRIVEENGSRQKSRVCESFDHLYALLEERKGELMATISSEQDEKVTYINRLRRCYTEHLENMAKVLEEGIKIMDEPEMAVFLQNAKPLLTQITEGTNTSHLEKLERGYEDMDHFTANFNRVRQALHNVDFNREDEEEEDEEEEAEGGAVSSPTPRPAVSTPTPRPASTLGSTPTPRPPSSPAPQQAAATSSSAPVATHNPPQSLNQTPKPLPTPPVATDTSAQATEIIL